VSRSRPEPIDEGTVLRSWTAPGVDLERDARLTCDSYAFVTDLGGGRAWLELRGVPSPALLDWGEARAAEKGRRILSGAWSEDAAALAALEAREYVLIRNGLRMEIDLSEPTPLPAWPEGIEARSFREGDARVFYEMHQETFRDSWEPIEESYEDWTHWLLEPPAFEPDLWCLARARDEPAGFAVCHTHSARSELGWIRILGVRQPWRRQGLGRALLLHSFARFRECGLTRAGLGVDATSLTGANRLYERAGMHVIWRFDIYEKGLA
jgi:mycothiol synthase